MSRKLQAHPQQPADKTLACPQLGLKPQTTNPGLEVSSTSQGIPTDKYGYPTRNCGHWRMGGHNGQESPKHRRAPASLHTGYQTQLGSADRPNVSS